MVQYFVWRIIDEYNEKRGPRMDHLGTPDLTDLPPEHIPLMVFI